MQNHHAEDRARALWKILKCGAAINIVCTLSYLALLVNPNFAIANACPFHSLIFLLAQLAILHLEYHYTNKIRKLAITHREIFPQAILQHPLLLAFCAFSLANNFLPEFYANAVAILLFILALTLTSLWRSVAHFFSKKIDDTMSPELTTLLAECFQLAAIDPVTCIEISNYAQSPNAFCSKNAIIFTTGLEKEIGATGFKAIILHEIGHMKAQHLAKKARLLRQAMWTALGCGIIGMMAYMFWLIHQRLETGVTTTQVIILKNAVYYAYAALFMFIYTLIAKKVSRKHEFEADALAVKMGADPLALSQALIKINQISDNAPLPNPTLLESSVNWLGSFFATHPDTAERSHRMLNEHMTNTQQPR